VTSTWIVAIGINLYGIFSGNGTAVIIGVLITILGAYQLWKLQE
jgi:hypothetical protein